MPRQKRRRFLIRQKRKRRFDTGYRTLIVPEQIEGRKGVEKIIKGRHVPDNIELRSEPGNAVYYLGDFPKKVGTKGVTLTWVYKGGIDILLPRRLNLPGVTYMEIPLVFVPAKERGKGIGRKFLQLAVNLAKKRNIEIVWLRTRQDPAFEPMIQLALTEGFCVVHGKLGVPNSLLYMAKTIRQV
jgi:GNAT superfamily N-acetyltransferase